MTYNDDIFPLNLTAKMAGANFKRHREGGEGGNVFSVPSSCSNQLKRPGSGLTVQAVLLLSYPPSGKAL